MPSSKPTAWFPGIDFGHPSMRDLSVAYPFWEGAGSIISSVYRPNRNQGTISGTSWDRAGSLGYALEFNDNSGTAEVALGEENLWGFTEPHTVIIRFWVDAFTDSFPGLFHLKTGGGGDTGFNCFLSTTEAAYRPVSFGTGVSGGGVPRFQVSTDFSAEMVNAWTTIAIAFNGGDETTPGSYDFARDGQEYAIEDGANFAAHGDNNVIGRAGTSANRLDGLIDFFAVWDRVMPVAEMKVLTIDPFAPFRQPDMSAIWGSAVGAAAGTTVGGLALAGVGI